MTLPLDQDLNPISEEEMGFCFLSAETGFRQEMFRIIVGHYIRHILLKFYPVAKKLHSHIPGKSDPRLGFIF
jgi:hypothetical protein